MKEVSVIRSRFLAAQADWLSTYPIASLSGPFAPHPTAYVHAQTHWHFRQPVLLELSVRDIENRGQQQLLLSYPRLLG